jgi:hypothetical protein
MNRVCTTSILRAHDGFTPMISDLLFYAETREDWSGSVKSFVGSAGDAGGVES